MHLRPRVESGAQPARRIRSRHRFMRPPFKKPDRSKADRNSAATAACLPLRDRCMTVSLPLLKIGLIWCFVSFWHVASFAATQDVRRFRREADMNRQARSATSVANDPSETLASSLNRVCFQFAWPSLLPYDDWPEPRGGNATAVQSRWRTRLSAVCREARYHVRSTARVGNRRIGWRALRGTHAA